MSTNHDTKDIQQHIKVYMIVFATLAAPPGLSIEESTSIIGTGASGEIRLTDPIQYLSSIMSPITSIFFLLIIYLFDKMVSHSSYLPYFPLIRLK